MTAKCQLKKRERDQIYISHFHALLYGKEGVGVEGGERLRVTEPRKRAGIDVHKAFSTCNSATNKSWILTHSKEKGRKKGEEKKDESRSHSI